MYGRDKLGKERSKGKRAANLLAGQNLDG